MPSGTVGRFSKPFSCGAVCVGIVQLQANVKKVTRDFKLPEKFVDMSYAVFKQLDLDANGAIDQQ